VLSPENERIFLVHYPGRYVFTDSIIVYGVGDTWYIPIEDLVLSLGLFIETSKDKKIVKGFILDKDNEFEIDTKTCELDFKGDTKKYPCEKVSFYDGALYGEMKFLEEWLPVKLKSFPLKSEIAVYPDALLPPLAKIEREKKSSDKYKRQDIAYNEIEVPRSWLDGFSLDAKVGRREDRNENLELGYYTQEYRFNAEFLKTDLYAYYNIEQPGSYDVWGSLSVKDPKRDLFGIGGSRLELGYFNADRIPLIIGGERWLGLYYSNKPMEYPSTFGVKDFAGELLNGWEVELYQNGVFLGRRTSGKDGRYNFRKIPLYYGSNNFKFIFYGPHGEERIEHKNYSFGKTFFKDKAGIYFLGLGLDRNNNPSAQVSYERTLFDNLTMRAGYSQYQFLEKKQDYFSLGFDSYIRTLIFGGNFGYQKDTQGMVGEGSLRTRVGFLNLGVAGAYAENYKSLSFSPFNEIKYEIKGDLSFPIKFIPGFNTRFRYEKREFYDQPSRTIIEGRASFFNRFLNLDGSYIYTPDGLDNGDIGVRKAWDEHSFRLRTKYNVYKFNSYGLNYRLRALKNFSLGVDFEYYEDIKLMSYMVNTSYNFNKFILELNAESNSAGTLRGWLKIGTGLLLNTPRKKVDFFGEALNGKGFAEAFVFLDVDNDGVYDSNEKALEGVEILLKSKRKNVKTNSNGYAFLNHLPTNTSTLLQVVEDSLPNIYWVPRKKNLKFYARQGKVSKIDIPIAVVGEVEGEVFTQNSKESVARINVFLFNKKGKVIKKTITDNTGYFIFQKVSPGSYYVIPNIKGKEFEPRRTLAIIPKDGDTISGLSFKLKK
jgi:hypothetical protein